jgi:recombination protein RecT
MSNITRPISALPEVRLQLEKMEPEFAKMLPQHISPDKFVRVVLTAIQDNPDLLAVERRSLFNACMRAATDGLIPDGKRGAIVVYRDKKRGTKMAQWVPMIAGLREMVRNSGEIVTWDAHVVCEHDQWEYEEGDHARILHKPVRGDRGPVIAAYSIARLRNGEISREWMWIEELDKVRAASRAEGGPWTFWFDEMCKKTVAKRHAKVLPMSTDIEGMFEREDAEARPPPVRKEDDPTRSATVRALDRLAKGSNAAGPDAWTDNPGEQAEIDEGDPDQDEIVDEGEYAESDDEQLPEQEQRR